MANLATNNGIRIAAPLDEMRVPLAVSVFIHLALILFAIYGLNLLPQKPLDTPTPIAISMINPSDIARTNHVDAPHEEKEPIEPQQSKAPEPPKEAQSSAPPPPLEPPVEQKVETPPAPPPPPPAPPEKPLPKLEPVPKADTSFQQPAELPKLQKPVKIVKPQPAPPPKPDQQKAKQIDQDFDSLLKNLTPVQKADQISKDKPVKAHARAAQQGALSDQMTADELGLIHDRLKQCWIIPPGGVDSGIKVQIVAIYNQDKTLSQALVQDDGSHYNNDPIYRALADSAVRALHNPTCNPLPLPDGKYDDWHQITMNFDPKND